MMSRDLFMDGDGSDFDGISLPPNLEPLSFELGSLTDSQVLRSQSPSSTGDSSAPRNPGGSSARHVPAASRIMNVRTRGPGTVRAVEDVDALKVTQQQPFATLPSIPSPSPLPLPLPPASSIPALPVSSSSSAGGERPPSLGPGMSVSTPHLPTRAAAASSASCNLILDLLKEPIVDMSRLRKASWNGVPLRVRATVWQLLLGYLPSNQERRESTLERKRLEYAKYRDRYFSETAVAERDDEERELLHQISIDVLRTHPNTLLFRDQRIQDAMTRALYIWAIRHPASGYVQGINELITPFIVVFLYDEVMRQSSDGPSADSLDRRLTAETTDVQEWLVRTTSFDRSLAGLDVIEADAFGCLTKLLSNVQTHYTFAQPGIQRMLFKLEAVMKRIDPSLCGHLEKQQASFLVLSFRWMNCYLMREIPLHHIIRMWDTYMCEDEGFSTFHVYVCGAFLAMWSQKLMQCDFQGIMLFVQSLPTDAWTREDVEVLLSKAFMHKAQHEPHLSHLK